MVEKVFTVTIKSTHADDQKTDTPDAEAESLRDMILDGAGYPLTLDTGELSVIVTCDSIKHE